MIIHLRGHQDIGGVFNKYGQHQKVRPDCGRASCSVNTYQGRVKDYTFEMIDLPINPPRFLHNQTAPFPRL
jgi:hypothetical protein